MMKAVQEYTHGTPYVDLAIAMEWNFLEEENFRKTQLLLRGKNTTALSAAPAPTPSSGINQNPLWKGPIPWYSLATAQLC